MCIYTYLCIRCAHWSIPAARVNRRNGTLAAPLVALIRHHDPKARHRLHVQPDNLRRVCVCECFCVCLCVSLCVFQSSRIISVP